MELFQESFLSKAEELEMFQVENGNERELGINLDLLVRS